MLLTISRKGHVSWRLNNFQTATCDRYNRRQLIVYVSAMMLFVKSGTGVFKALIKRHDVVKLALHGRRRKIGRF